MISLYGLFVGLVLALTGLIGYSTFATAQLLRQWRPEGNLLLLPGEHGVRLVLIGLCWGLGRMSGLPAPVLGWTFPRVGEQLVWGGILGLGLALFFVLSTRWLVGRTGERFYSSTIIAYILPANGREALLIPLALVPVVLLEELLFRSLWIGGMGLALPPLFLWLVAALLFGLLHSPQGAWGVAGAALAGLIFGALFLWQGSLLMPMAAHYVANLVQIFYAARLQGQGRL